MANFKELTNKNIEIKKYPNLDKTKIKNEILLIDDKTKDLLFKYFICEKLATKIIECSSGKPKSKNNFRIDNLKKALKFYNVIYEDNSIDVLFLTSYKNENYTSLRNNRNKIVHDMNAKAINEIKSHYHMYDKFMDNFIDLCCNIGK